MAERIEVMSEYVACLRRIWAVNGSPSVDQIAVRTRRTLFPMSPEQVGEYLRGAVVPESSLMVHALWHGITGSDGHRPDDEDHPRLFRLWRSAVGEPEPNPTEPLPIVPEHIGREETAPPVPLMPPAPPPRPAPAPPAAPLPDIVEQAVEVAGYLAAAGIGGIIGNRADAVVAWTTSRLFQSVRDRWRSRGAGTDEPLSEEEAVDAAIAAAIALDYSLETLQVTGTEQRSDGSWRVALAAQGEVLRARVPAGDPADATILIIPG